MSYLVVSVAALVVAALTLFSGFGLGTLLMPVFAVFFPVETAVAANVVLVMRVSPYTSSGACDRSLLPR